MSHKDSEPKKMAETKQNMKLSKYAANDLAVLGWNKVHSLRWERDGSVLYRDNGEWRLDDGKKDKYFAATLGEAVDKLLQKPEKPANKKS